MNIITPEQAETTEYDVVIVGGGISGAIVAKTLTQAGKRCLIVEAGTGLGTDYQGYLDYLNTFYTATIKIPNAPYPSTPNAPEPLETEVSKTPSDKGYFVQRGPLPFSSTYTRYLGGTTLHWLGTSLRMLPEDFRLKSLYGVGIDWPIDYQELEPWYRKAELELGVSANVEEQSYLGVTFPPGYVYPMHGLPASWSDKQLASRIDGMQVEDDGKSYTLKVRGTPASRNSVPNSDYDQGRGYTPKGAVGNDKVGHRCMGNSSCVPICPIQAKYNALKTLNTANHEMLDIVLQSVAFQLDIDPHSKAINGVQFKHYRYPGDDSYSLHTVKGKRYVLAAHAVANAVLLLASGACKGNDLVGRHLMDHPELLTWGLTKKTPLWPLRGPLATSGIEDLRGGSFRKHHAPYRFEMGNDGWLWPAQAPSKDVITLVDDEQLHGKELRQRLKDQVSRQFRFGILVEQLPEYDNRVTIDPNYLDMMGNYRPVIHYDLSPYTRAGFASAYDMSMKIFDQADIKNYSSYSKEDAGAFVCPDGSTLTFNGAGHFAGTHCMGGSPESSVVNKYQRTWEHPNLYLVGCGNMINMGTSNPTLTMSALTCWASHNILQDLNGGHHAAD
ncbi:GMC family oxidoreductase [Serratia fonticola]